MEDGAGLISATATSMIWSRRRRRGDSATAAATTAVSRRGTRGRQGGRRGGPCPPTTAVRTTSGRCRRRRRSTGFTSRGTPRRPGPRPRRGGVRRGREATTTRCRRRRRPPAATTTTLTILSDIIIRITHRALRRRIIAQRYFRLHLLVDEIVLRVRHEKFVLVRYAGGPRRCLPREPAIIGVMSAVPFLKDQNQDRGPKWSHGASRPIPGPQDNNITLKIYRFGDFLPGQSVGVILQNSVEVIQVIRFCVPVETEQAVM